MTAGSGGSAGEAGSGPESGGTATNAGSGPQAGSAGTSSSTLSSVELTGAPLYTRVQRLTLSQWEHAVTDILRFGESHDLSEMFLRPVLGVTDFDNNEKLLFVDSASFGDFETGAESAAAIATGSEAALAALYDGDDAAGFVSTLGRRAFRRPLTDDEAARYEQIFAQGEALYGAGFANGAALVIRALLESPHFLYRTELGPAGDALSGYEVASKLSFWLLGTTPSDELLDAAGAGELDGVDGLEATARAMLEEPTARDVMQDFHGQLMRLADYAEVAKPDVPEFDQSLGTELGAASSAFFDHVFSDGFGLREILSGQQAYVGAGLAPLYGLSAPPDGLELVELPASRRGFFMQVPFLLRWGVNRDSDPNGRGLFVQRMLCDARPAADPLGHALEGFDGMGQERDTVDGAPVDTKGSYPLAEGVQDFADGTELMRILSDSAQAHTCYAKYVTGYALGRDIIEPDRPLLEALAQVSLAESLKELIVALVRDPAFRTRQEGTP